MTLLSTLSATVVQLTSEFEEIPTERKETLQELSAVANEILEKAGLTAMNQKLQSF